LILFKSSLSERPIYLQTREKILEQIKKVCSTLPATQLATYFELHCCKEIVKSLEPGKGKWKEVAREHAQPLLEGLVKALLSISPATPAACLAPLVSPMFRLAVRIYQEREAGWHGDVWTLRWSFTRLTTLEQWNQAEFQQGIQQCHKHYHVAFCLSEMCMDLIQKTPEKSLKEVALNQLLRLADLSNGSTMADLLLKDKFWRVRYRTIEHIKVLANQPDFEALVIEKLLQRLSVEKDHRVASLLHRTCLELAPKNAQQLQALAEKMRQQAEALKQKNQSDKHTVESKKQALQEEKQKKSGLLEKLGLRKKDLQTGKHLEADTPTQNVEEQLEKIAKFEQQLPKEIAELERQAIGLQEIQRGLKCQLDNLNLLEQLSGKTAHETSLK
jgi:hypothetical protein